MLSSYCTLYRITEGRRDWFRTLRVGAIGQPHLLQVLQPGVESATCYVHLPYSVGVVQGSHDPPNAVMEGASHRLHLSPSAKVVRGSHDTELWKAQPVLVT